MLLSSRLEKLCGANLNFHRRLMMLVMMMLMMKRLLTLIVQLIGDEHALEHEPIAFRVGRVQVELLDSNHTVVERGHDKQPHDHVQEHIVDEI